MKSIMGFILTGDENHKIKELLQRRSVASIPIGGKYRLIDFVLSNMIHSRISNVAITTQYQFRSLMDHLGSGKEWGLDRKIDGLFIFPPFLTEGQSTTWYNGTVDAIHRNMRYIERSTQEYIVITPDDSVYRLDFQDVVDYHIQMQADITLVYKNVSDMDLQQLGILELNDSGFIIGFEQYPEFPKTSLASMGIYVMRRDFLMEIMHRYRTEGTVDFVTDILIKHLEALKIAGYAFEDYWRPINTIQAYYDCNMDMIDPDIALRLFRGNGTIYTKLKDYPSSYFDKDSRCINSIVPEGCHINGLIQNSVLFRGVTVKEGAQIYNSIIMQDTLIEENCVISNAIIDKGMVIKENTSLEGDTNKPLIVQKNK